MNKELVQIPHATLEFYRYEKDDLVFYEFDASESQSPEPMVNSICALQFIKQKNERVVGVFFHEPFPLYQKISKHFDYESFEMENGNFVVTFKRK